MVHHQRSWPAALRRTTGTRRHLLRTLTAGAALAVGAGRGRGGLAGLPSPGRALRASAAQANDGPIKAVYFNPRATDPDGFALLVDLIERTELNALVVDVKEDGIFYETEVELFRSAGIATPLTDVGTVVRTLRERGIYAIARLVVFKDTPVADAYPHLAVTDATTGAPWRDSSGAGWGNPFATELWEANADLAAELAGLGFAEVQLDYVRFPSDGDLGAMDFGQPATAEAQIKAIAAFIGTVRDRLAPTGVRLAADVFGYTLVVDDIGIGQNLARIAPVVDYLCPMVYPSHWPEGSLGLDGHPNDFPYETVALSLAAGTAIVPGVAPKLRPWLQDFSLAGLSDYGTAEVRAQIDAAEAAGGGGWMIWNVSNTYHEDAFAPAE